MHTPLNAGFSWDNIFIYVLIALAILIFLVAYYFIRKSLQPTEDFNNKMLSMMTAEDKEESLLYCISFFQDAYDSKVLPGMSEFMELRVRAAAVFTFYKNVRRAAYVYMKLKDYYYKDKPLPDLTDRYKDDLLKDGRSKKDIISAFCMCGVEEFSKLLK